MASDTAAGYGTWTLYVSNGVSIFKCNEYSCIEGGIYCRIIYINDQLWDQWACERHAINKQDNNNVTYQQDKFGY